MQELQTQPLLELDWIPTRFRILNLLHSSILKWSSMMLRMKKQTRSLTPSRKKIERATQCAQVELSDDQTGPSERSSAAEH